MTSRFGKENMDDKKKEVVENTEIVPVEITEELLKEKLYEVRGVKVMLDSDLAEMLTMFPSGNRIRPVAVCVTRRTRGRTLVTVRLPNSQ